MIDFELMTRIDPNAARLTLFGVIESAHSSHR